MKRIIATLAISIIAVPLLSLSACTMANGRVSQGRQAVTHSHSHNHKGVPRHHDGSYHQITRVHEHTHD